MTVFVFLQKYHKTCAHVPNSVNLYQNSHLGKNVFLGRRTFFPFSLFSDKLKKKYPGLDNRERISFSLVPRNLILIKVTRN